MGPGLLSRQGDLMVRPGAGVLRGAATLPWVFRPQPLPKSPALQNVTPSVKSASGKGLAMVDFIAAISDGQRAMALDAAEHHYLQTVQNLGRTEGPPRMWVSAFMSHLNYNKGTSNNCHRSSGAPNLPANDSALFSFRFCAVHPKDVRDSQLRQLFEVPYRDSAGAFKNNALLSH